MSYIVSELFIYPVKSLGGFSVASSALTDRGLEFDRRWMLIDQQNRFLSQREFPELALFQTEINNGELIIYRRENKTDSLNISLNPILNETLNVSIWDDQCEAILINDEANQWFSQKLGSSARLVYMPDDSKRVVDRKYTQQEELTGFSDGYPILLIGQSSLDDLNSRLLEPVAMDRFRPNVVFSGGDPYVEDDFKHFQINGIDMYGVKLCARCVMTTIDKNTAKSGKEPLATLSQYRREGNKVNFGQNVIFHGRGSISVGDTITLLK